MFLDFVRVCGCVNATMNAHIGQLSTWTYFGTSLGLPLQPHIMNPFPTCLQTKAMRRLASLSYMNLQTRNLLTHRFMWSGPTTSTSSYRRVNPFLCACSLSWATQFFVSILNRVTFVYHIVITELSATGGFKLASPSARLSFLVRPFSMIYPFPAVSFVFPVNVTRRLSLSSQQRRKPRPFQTWAQGSGW